METTNTNMSLSPQTVAFLGNTLGSNHVRKQTPIGDLIETIETDGVQAYMDICECIECLPVAEDMPVTMKTVAQSPKVRAQIALNALEYIKAFA